MKAVQTAVLLCMLSIIVFAKSKNCRKNEVWSECGNNGCRNTCTNPTLETTCRGICNPGCKCKKGYIWNSKKDCVLPKDCDNLTCRQNEELSDCADENCRVTCSNFGETLSCTPICKPGCVCKSGFIRSIINLCIKPTQCENNVCPKDNEVYTDCLSPCGETCATLGQDITCNFLVCNPGCDCSEGYFRNSKGDCVLPEDCDSQCGENEVWKDCGTCDPSCENLKPTCMYARICRKGCYCKPGYARQDGECIPEEDCPANIICTGVNEEYSKCGNNSCQLNCDTYGKNYLCKPICNPGCICKEPFIRDSNGICIHPSECEECSGKNYIFKECGPTTPKTCKTKHQPIEPSDECVSGCFCKDSYVLDDDNNCILPEECPEEEECGINEVYSTCGSCDGSCDNPFPICTTECRVGYFCKSGYVRENSICIPKKKCKPSNKCIRKNYIYKSCGTACPLACRNKDSSIDCSSICVSGCFCKDGYVLDDDKNCILPEQCPKRCPDRNAELVKCPNPCLGGTCRRPKFSPCRMHCKDEGCQCKKGYVKWSDDNPTCVPLWKCRRIEPYSDSY